MVAAHRILVLDDEAAARFALADFLRGRGYEVDEAGDCRSALTSFRDNGPDLALVDYSLPDGNALELLPRLKELDASVPVVILTGHGSIDLAVRAIQEGADQFLTKPVELAAVATVVERLLEARTNRQKQLAGRARRERQPIDPFLGVSPAIRALAEEARAVAPADSPILILGETGTGKSVLARWIHETSPRADAPFVDLNCAGLARDFLESELFGHERGAFTGAVAAKPGLLEVANRGTLFLDEIGDVDPAVQPKILKALEEKRFRRMGEVRDRRVDLRLVAATHQDLPRLVRENRFRSDLYFRINTLPLRVPPLRERREDLPLLAEGLLQNVAADLGRPHVALSAAAIEKLAGHTWPGNIRELRNCLERAVLLSKRDQLEARDLRFEVPLEDSDEPSSELTLDELERRHIERVLGEEKGHVERSAKRLGIPRSSLYNKIKHYRLESSKA